MKKKKNNRTKKPKPRNNLKRPTRPVEDFEIVQINEKLLNNSKSTMGLTANLFNRNKVNKAFIDFLSKATPGDRSEVAHLVYVLDLLPVPTDENLLNGIFTQKRSDLVMNPLVVKFGLEDFSYYAHRDEQEMWLDTTAIFLGEIPFQIIEEGEDINGIGLEELLADYYEKNNLGPIPKEYLTYLKNFHLKGEGKKPWTAEREREIIYYSLIRNMGTKLRLFLLRGNGKKIDRFARKLIETQNRFKSNSLYSINPGSSVSLQMEMFLEIMYVSIITRYLLDKPDLNKAEEVLKLLGEEIDLFSANKDDYNDMVALVTLLLSDTMLTILEESEHKFKSVNVPESLTLILDLVMDLNLSLLEQDTSKALFYFVTGLCSALAHYLGRIKRPLGEKYKPSTYEDSQFEKTDLRFKEIDVDISVKKLDSIARKVEAAALECIDQFKNIIKDGDKNTIGLCATQIVECTKILTLYYKTLDRDSEYTLAMWEGLEAYLQKLVKLKGAPSPWLRAASLYAKIFLLNLYLYPKFGMFDIDLKEIEENFNYDISEEDIKKVKEIFRSGKGDAANMKKVGARTGSNTALQLAYWYNFMAGEHPENITGMDSREARGNLDEVLELFDVYGIDNTGSIDFEWDF